MRILRITGFALILMLFFLLASGRFLRSGTSDPVILLLATGLLLLSAAFATLVTKDTKVTKGKITLYLICAGLIASVQLTGGSASIFYSAYLLFLMWASLPSITGAAIELGLIIGFVEAFSLLNATIWTGGDPFVSRLIPLLLPALKALLVPFIFGLTSDWLMEKEFSLEKTKISVKSNKIKKEDKSSSLIDSNISVPLLQIMHKNSKADSTCLFVRSDDKFFRLEEYIAADNTIISRFMLPARHRLARIAENSDDTVSIRVDFGEERSELTPYHLPRAGEEGTLWIVLCPLKTDDSFEGFLLQDFTGETPSASTISELQKVSGILHRTCEKESFPPMDEFMWMAKLVSACRESNLDKAVHGMAGILTEILTDSTISIADVDSQHSRTRVWVSRGPLARWRRGKTFDSAAGMAGWIVKNRVPCRRSRIKYGEKYIYAFTAESHAHDITGSCMGVPVIRDGNVIALIMAENEDDNAFMQHHEGILLAAAGMFSMREELAGLRHRFMSILGWDTLTGLPGITLLDSHLHHMAKEVQKYGWYAGVIVADLDGFALLNRKLGYSEGDHLLVNAADLFKNCFSDDVFVARIGPDSFAACIPRTGKAAMEAMSQRAADALSFKYNRKSADTSLSVSASIGSAYTHVNRKVLLLALEAIKAASEASAAGRGTSIVRKIGLSGQENG